MLKLKVRINTKFKDSLQMQSSASLLCASIENLKLLEF